MTTPRLLPPVVYAKFAIDDQAGVQDWVARHQDDYVLKEPVLVTLKEGDVVWCYGASASFIETQQRTVIAISARTAPRQQMGPPGVLPAIGPMPTLRPPR